MTHRLDVLVRIRTEAEERAALAHGRAVAVVEDATRAADAALEALRAARGDGPEVLTSAATLQHRGAHLRRLEARFTDEQARLTEARRRTGVARDAHVAARAQSRALTSLRDREHERRRRAWDAAQEEELQEAATASLRRRVERIP